MHWEVVFGAMPAGKHDTVTDVIEEGAAVTGIFFVPDFEKSCTLVAFTVAVVAPAGAVYRPVGLIAPPPTTDQVTALLYAPVPLTVGVHWEVPLTETLTGKHETVTDVIVGGATQSELIAQEFVQEPAVLAAATQEFPEHVLCVPTVTVFEQTPVPTLQVSVVQPLPSLQSALVAQPPGPAAAIVTAILFVA